jgi:dTDP-4-dehydrorhamnose reductase
MTTPKPFTGRVLILGATGMLGHTLLRLLAGSAGIDAIGTARNDAAVRLLPAHLHSRVRIGLHAEDGAALAALLRDVRPQAVINCIGIVKQLAAADDPAVAMPINAEFPHRLAAACAAAGARLVHISTDCVFAGTRGRYSEADTPDAQDLYGRSKAMGEVDAPHAITLRTSIIGPELGGSTHGLLAWFLAQRGTVNAYTRAVFSGLPTVELARVIRDHVLTRPQLHGIHHVAAEAIDKAALLRLLAEAYAHPVALRALAEPVIDRSLDGRRFAAATGYVAAPWPTLVERMHAFG